MISKRKPPGGSGLYVILDRDFLSGKEILKVARLALSGGADIIQFRDKRSTTIEMIKTGKELKKIAGAYRKPLIINDRVDVAVGIDADGLHIGQGDVDISCARKIIGKEKLIGVSVKNFYQAKKAMEEGADYLSAGPVFKTPIKKAQKPKGFKLLGRLKRLNIPFFAIGGINYKNVHKLTERGFKNIALIRAVCKSRDPYRSTKILKEALV